MIHFASAAARGAGPAADQDAERNREGGSEGGGRGGKKKRKREEGRKRGSEGGSEGAREEARERGREGETERLIRLAVNGPRSWPGRLQSSGVGRRRWRRARRVASWLLRAAPRRKPQRRMPKLCKLQCYAGYIQVTQVTYGLRSSAPPSQDKSKRLAPGPTKFEARPIHARTCRPGSAARPPPPGLKF